MQKKVVVGLLSLGLAILLILGAFAGVVPAETFESENEFSETDIVLVSLDGEDDVASIDSNGIDILESYPDTVLAEISEQRKAELIEEGYSIEPLENRDHVGLQSHSFNTDEGEPDIPESLEIDEYPDDGSGYYIVQFIGPISSEWKEEIRDMGVIFHEFRHNFNFIVEMDRETKESVEEKEFVNWAGIYQPAYRFDDELLDEDGTLELEVKTFDSPGTLMTADKISNFAEGNTLFIGEDRMTVEMDSENIEALANLHEVKSIERGGFDLEFFNEDATWIAQTNEYDNRKVTEEGVTGTGQLITVMDSELYGGNSNNPDHEMWADPDGNPVGDDHRKIQEHYAPPGGGDINAGQYHGTHVTGSVLGDAPPYDAYDNNDGNAIGARLIFQDVDDGGWGLSIPDDMYNDAYGASYDSGSRVHTNSWGGGSGYGSSAQTSDQFIWDQPDYNILYAMGNDGSGANTISAQAEGKNVMSIGAVVNYPDQDDVASFSSRGYADDGRIKPTVMHVGENLVSADQSTDGYSSMSGTSMSTPSVAGQIGQIREYYEGGWYPSGSPDTADGFNPSHALVRATLINGAVEISGSGAYNNDNRFPNGDQGYGRSMLDRALHFEGDERDLEVYDSWNEGVELDTGESWEMEFNVEDPDQELEVTLAWNDYPGSSGSDANDPAIVNDLDLELETPGGTRYVGNAFTGSNPGYSEANPTSNPWSGQRNGEYDGLNVEENILLLPDHNGVETGTYKLTVSGYNVPEDTQPFAVVVSGGLDDEPVPDELDADFTYEQVEPIEEYTMDFTDQSSPGEYEITDWYWEFGDGTTSTEQNPTRSYAQAGEYDVSLTITDAAGEDDTEVKTVEVEEPSYCEVDGGDTSYGEYITNVQFNGIDRSSGDDGGYADHTDSVSDPVEPGQTYELSVTASTGGYNNGLTVVIDWSQDYDLTNEEVIEIGMGDDDPLTVTTSITVPEDASEGETRMRVMQEYDSYHYEPCEDQNYGETEDYTVAIGEDDDPEPEGPEADFTYDPPVPTEGETVQFTDQSIEGDGSIVDWSWDFGDGTTSGEQHPSYVYDQAGTYTIELTVTDDNDLSDSTTDSITVEEDDDEEPGEYCEVDGGDTSYGEYITNVQFNGIDRSSGDDGGYADHTDSVSDPVEPGQTYELSVTISTGGYSNYVTVVIDWSQDYDLSNEEVIEVGYGSSDPQTVTTSIIVPEYAEEGETRMRVMQEYNEYHYEPCENQNYGETEDYTVAIGEDDDPEPEGPEADFTYDPAVPTEGETVQFTDQSIEGDGSIVDWSWDFGDGTTSGEQHPSHVYDQAGTYTIELTVTDDNDLSDSTTDSITVEEDDDEEPGEYCEVDGGDTSYGEYITNVQFNGIDRSSGDDGGYADHTDSVSDPVEPGQTYELSVTISTGGYSNYVTVVIDWSQDYDLSNEEVIEVGYGSSDPQTVTTSIIVPEYAEEGETRMRVMQEYNEYHYEPCENQNYGETEDYTVTIGEDDDDDDDDDDYNYYTATNSEHRDEGRAYRQWSWGEWSYVYYAVGSGDYLGSGSDETTLREIEEGEHYELVDDS